MHPNYLTMGNRKSEYSEVTSDENDLEDGGLVVNGNDSFSDEASNAQDNAGAIRSRRSRSGRGSYRAVTINNDYTHRPSFCSRCCGCIVSLFCGFTSVLCQTVVIVTAMLLIGGMGYLLGSQDPDFLIATLNGTAGVDLVGLTNGGVISVGGMEEIDNIKVVDNETSANENITGCVELDLNETTEGEEQGEKKATVKVRYDPSAVLANSIKGDSSNPFDLPRNYNSIFMTPPHPFSTGSSGDGVDPAPVGYLKNPHLADGRLVFLSEGDVFVTTLGDSAMPASKVTTTLGNALDPKWHPTLPLLAYTATYAGRRDVYLKDLSPSSMNKSPMRLTYWDVSHGVSGIVGWIKSDSGAEHADALVIRALRNDASLPDYRLYVIHLSDNPSISGSSTSPILEIEPVPLAQARDAARFNNCWYFVRVSQSSQTIRYVGGTVENLWKYCDDAPSSNLLLNNDNYRGTGKSPQQYRVKEQTYLFFLSDREYDKKKKKWIPGRMNVWALPLSDDDSNKKKYGPGALIQITDTACDFEGRTIQEYSIDESTGDLVVRIGADLYIMARKDVKSKIRSEGRKRFLEEQDEEAKELQKIVESEMEEDEEQDETVSDEELVVEGEPSEDQTVETDNLLASSEDMEEFADFDSDEDFSNTTDSFEDVEQDKEETISDEELEVEGEPSEDQTVETDNLLASSEDMGEFADFDSDEDNLNTPDSPTFEDEAIETEENDESIENEEQFSNPADSSTLITSEDNDDITTEVLISIDSESEIVSTSTDSPISPASDNADSTVIDETINDAAVDLRAEENGAVNIGTTIEDGNSTEPPAKYFYDFKRPEITSRIADEGEQDHYSGESSELKRLPIVIYSDFYNDQERIVPVDIMEHLTSGDVYESITGSTQMLMTLRGQLWVAPITDDEIPLYKEATKNLPARRYRVAPGAMMGGATRILAAMHVPNPVEDDESDRRLAVILATDPLTPTAEHAFYLIETQAGASPLFVDMDQLPKPFLGGLESGGSTRDGGLGSVKTDTLAMSPCGNRMAWSDTDGRIVVMNMPQYQDISDEPVKYVVLPKKNELGEPMIGDEVELSFSPGGRYLSIEHSAKNQFSIISIADLGDPLGEENKIADITIGRIVQATPSRFNSNSVVWGKTPTDIHDLETNHTMSKLFGTEEADDVSTTLYFLSDRDIYTDVRSPWGTRQRLPHFVESRAIYALPFQAKDLEEPPKGQFRGSGAEELQVEALLERSKLLDALLESKKSASVGTTTTSSRREKRILMESVHPLSGAFGLAKKAFDEKNQRKLKDSGENDEKNIDDKEQDHDETYNSTGVDEDDRFKEAEFPTDMDIDFGPVDLTFARRAYRLSNIPAGAYTGLVCQCPDGSISAVEGDHLVMFEAEGFPSDQYEQHKFTATSRKLVSHSLSANRKFVVLVYAPDGAIRVVPNTASGMKGLMVDLELDENVVDKDGMHLSIWPTIEYRQLYDDAWRMLRDYFYDPDMTGIDWPAIHERYLPLVERCSKREELDDVLSQMSSELSALHVFVYGGEYNDPYHGDEDLKNANSVGSLGAILRRSPAWKGYTVMSIPEADPDFTKIDHSSTIYSPLSDQSLRLSGQRGLEVGDVIVGVNGESVMSVPDIHMLLRGTAGRSVRLEVLRLASGAAAEAQPTNETGTDSSTKEEPQQNADEAAVEAVVTVPLSPDANSDLLYKAWAWKTEQLAEKLAEEAGISVGYVHLENMSGPQAEDAFARGFFPNYNKQAFILDVRHNNGGNIDSWVINVFQRKAWMYWESRDFDVENGGLGWDMHYAFQGHLVVLVDEKTSSDGEGVTRGISELGLGRVIGTRTWGGGIWLSSDNTLVDGGIATAPEIGDYNDNFGWGMGIEQMGLEPDIVVDNDPHETYAGKDRQLERAIQELSKWIEEEPVVVPKPKSKRKDMTMGDRECSARV